VTADYHWAPPEHPDPPENRPYGIDGVEWSVAVDHAPVTVHVEFSRTGWQDVPGFVDASADDRAYVQFVHMGFAYREWLPLDRLTKRQLKHRP
jgi:hypothetical protein